MFIFDDDRLGTRLRGARTTAGFGSMEEVNEALAQRYGITHGDGLPGYSIRGLRAIERGEQMPTMEQFLVLMMLYDPPGGCSFFTGAVKPEYAEDFNRSFCKA